MEEIRRKQQVLSEHQTGMNAHTHPLVVILSRKPMEEIRTKHQVINEHQTGMNAHTYPLVVMVK